MAGCACDCAVSCASATPDRDAGVVMTIGAGPMPILPRTGCSPWPQPMPRPANPLAGEPPTGEPYAGNLLVRFGGRGKRVLLPTPITPPRLDTRWKTAGMTDVCRNSRFIGRDPTGADARL